MAQMQNLLRSKGAVGDWRGVAVPIPNTDRSRDTAVRRVGQAALTIAGGATAASPGMRTKVPGLRLGERKLLQGIGDWLVLSAGSLIILAQSERDYDLAAMIISLMVLTVLWFFFAGAFEAYNVLVIQTRFRNIYSVGKVLVATGISYTLLAWFAGGSLAIIRPRISEMLLAALI